MSKLPRYSVSTICPKCLHGDIAVHYRAYSRPFDPAWRSWWKDEYLLRVCQRCHYEWAEQTEDAKAEEVQP